MTMTLFVCRVDGVLGGAGGGRRGAAADDGRGHDGVRRRPHRGHLRRQRVHAHGRVRANYQGQLTLLLLNS